MTFRDLTARGLLGAVALAASAAILLAPAGAPRAQTAAPDPVEIGRVIAERDCSTCHAIGREGNSPFEGAPRWRDLHARFDVADLGEALAEGISVGHEAMPERTYEPAEVQALVAYLKSLEAVEPTVAGSR
ncbi:MAG: c-type cytochrome [Caulobacterales bacterium]|nr:c-type cytochrome [Caulobacterales bacterium]